SGDRLADLAPLGRRQADLCADVAFWFQRLQHPAEIDLGLPIAVHLRRIEIIDAELERPRHRAFLVRRGALDHQPANRAAAETEDAKVKTGPAKSALFHRRSLRCSVCVIATDQAPPGGACQLS